MALVTRAYADAIARARNEVARMIDAAMEKPKAKPVKQPAPTEGGSTKP